MSVSVPPVVNLGQRVYGTLIMQDFASYSVYTVFRYCNISFASMNFLPRRNVIDSKQYR